MPLSATEDGGHAADQRLARALAEAGLMTAADAERAADHAEACANALRRLLSPAPTEAFRIDLVVTNALATYEIRPSRSPDQADLRVEVADVAAATIGPGLMSLCRGEVRAARAVLACLDAAVLQGLPVFTPEVATLEADMLFWHGLGSAREARREALACGEDIETLAQIPDARRLLGAVPSWTATPWLGVDVPSDGRGRPLHRCADPIAPWRGRIDPQLESRCERLLAALREIEDPFAGDLFDASDGIEVDVPPIVPLLLKWRADDELERIYDEHLERAQEMGADGLLAIHRLSFDRPEAARRDLARARRALDLLQATDSLIALLDARTSEVRG